MSVESYRVSLLNINQCPIRYTIEELYILLKAWRKYHGFQQKCLKCENNLFFHDLSYTTCCQQFYFNSQLTCYPVQSIAIYTPNYAFLLPQMKRMLKQAIDTELELNNILTHQEFLVLPDPIYWQVTSTLIYEKVLKFVSGIPVTCRSNEIYPVSKTPTFYKQLQETPLNYGSLDSRSCGKATLIRQVAFGKRCLLSMRGMIVPDASLKPNQIRIPFKIVEKFKLRGQWVLLNRMPSLQPGNCVALQVTESNWPFDCFGIPLEIIDAINGDFDGDECNIYLVPNLQAQAECASLLNAEWEMGCFVMGLKLAPSQDMLVAHYLFYDEIDFLKYKNRDLKKTFRVIYDIYGSQEAFYAVDAMRKFYLKTLQDRICFALTLEEMNQLIQICQGKSFKEFEKEAEKMKTCLVTQVLSGAKGSMEHLYQMFGQVGWQNGTFVSNSFWQGLTPKEAVVHTMTAIDALSKLGKIWEPGYGYSKSVYNLQGLHVNYLGQLVDGDQVIETDVLNAIHHTDVMSEDAFDYLVEKTLIQSQNEM